jgi:hypothetical protein
MSPRCLVWVAGEKQLVNNPPELFLSRKHSVGENMLAPQQLIGLPAKTICNIFEIWRQKSKSEFSSYLSHLTQHSISDSELAGLTVSYMPIFSKMAFTQPGKLLYFINRFIKMQLEIKQEYL